MAASPTTRLIKEEEEGAPVANKISSLDDSLPDPVEEDDEDNLEDNTARRLSMLDEEVSFDADDSTEELQHPAAHFFVTQNGVKIETVRFTSLPHPRSGRMNAFAVASLEGTAGEGTLMELQRFKPQFSTLAFGNTIEPSSPLTLLLPIDPAFFALRLITTDLSPSCPIRESFVSFDDILDAAECGVARECFGPLPKSILRQIENQLAHFCQVEEIGDERYYKLATLTKINDWLNVKMKQMVESDDARRLLLGVDSSTVAQGENQAPCDADGEGEAPSPPVVIDLQLLKEKSLRMLLDYCPTALHESLTLAAGVRDLKSRSTNKSSGVAQVSGTGADAGPSHWERQKRGREDEDDIIVKAKPTVAKSASVKKLEKAGAPKGVPSIMGFFKKK